jgi:predicted Rossmann-fold nucleotide-binding protein
MTAPRDELMKAAAMAMLRGGFGTVAEIARLADTSRQRVRHWARFGVAGTSPPVRLDLDVTERRRALLADQWQRALHDAENCQ